MYVTFLIVITTGAVIAQIVNMLFDPISSQKRQLNKWTLLLEPLPFDILSMNLYMSWVVPNLPELQCNWKVQNHTQGPHKETIHNLSP